MTKEDIKLFISRIADESHLLEYCAQLCIKELAINAIEHEEELRKVLKARCTP